MKHTYIGIIANDEPGLVAGLLGILKSGNSFVPISPAYPHDRIDFIIKDCGIKVLLVDRANYEKARQVVNHNPLIDHLICIDDICIDDQIAAKEAGRDTGATEPEGDVDDPCYLIYTSGSTGRPKGVPITHRNLVPLFTWFREYFGLGTTTRVMQNLSYVFDFGVFEILTTVLYGGSLYLMDKGSIGEFAFYGEFINRHLIDTVHSTPVFFNNVVTAARQMPSLKIVHLGGERLTGKMVKDIARVVSSSCLLHNGYGPTEATINCSIFTLTAARAAEIEENLGIPIGRPTARNILYILDKNRGPQPMGAAGELAVAGAGLAQGYLNRPELTSEKFCLRRAGALFEKTAPAPRKNFLLSYSPTHPLTHSTIYLTGDLTRWQPDGNIEFLGRIDFQVKVRGFRIELGEIETRLLNLLEIKEAIVIAREHETGSHYLCAYFVIDPVKTQEPPSVSRLREHLAADLPDYMIPAYFIPLDRVPLTPTGKVDRKSLPEPDQSLINTGAEYVPPVTGTERDLVRIWQGLLRIEKIGIMDDFFELGGDSILANRCIARIREELSAEVPLRKFFEQPYIKSIAAEIEKKERRGESIPKGNREGIIPLSFAQERLWFLQELDTENAAYFVPRVIRITGTIEKELFERSFTEIIRRHEILRTRFVTIEGQPVQQIKPPYEFKIPLSDWSGEQESEREERVTRYLAEESRRPFDFEKGVLLRVALLKLKETEHLFVLTEHHLIHDGWTQGVLLREFIEIFTALGQGRSCPLPELPIQYADFALWQRRYLQGEVLDRHLDYWKTRLAGAPPVLDLPGDRPRPPVISGKGGMIPFHISPDMTAKLKEFGRKHNTTLFMTMLAVFKLFLYRYTGVEDLCVGTGIANRRYKEMEGMLGMVINTLPLRTGLSGDLPVNDLLHRVRETCLEAYQHEDTPFGKIVEALKPERSLSYMPLFQVMFSFMDTPTENLHLPGLELELLDFHNRSSKFDINVVVVPPPESGNREAHPQPTGEILVEWEYSTDIFDADTIERMIGHYTRLLEEVLGNSAETLAALPMLSAEETRRLVWDFNATAADYPAEKTIRELFVRQAERTPGSIALKGISEISSSGPVQVTYNELNARSERWAYRLKEKGVEPDSIVGIILERSMEMLTAILAVLKAGGAYMPIDPGYPEERVRYMLKDSGARVTITSETVSSLDNLSYKPVPPCSSHIIAGGSSLAYVIYTSGTTGKPKGNLVAHYNAVRVVKKTNYIHITPRDRILQLSNYAFDGSIFDILGALLNGATLVLLSREEVLSVDKLSGVIQNQAITVFFVTTALFNILVEESLDSLVYVRKVLFGGERVSIDHCRRALAFLGSGKVIHVYGPTETTVYATYYHIEQIAGNQLTVPIGRPIANTLVYILDRALNPVPVQVYGEIYIGGHGVCRGYLNSPELTAEKFLATEIIEEYNNRFLRGVQGGSFFKKRPPGRRRLYRTGDLARWLPDGNIEFLGRGDTQVKIRGFRIELSEIENCLLKLAGIKETVVMARQNQGGEKNLCAYIAADTEIPAAQLKRDLAKELPEYMIPSFFVFLQSLPLNPNGKVDRKALPEPGAGGASAVYVPPRNFVEEQLVHIWAGVLDRNVMPGVQNHSTLSSVIGIDDNFFELGGHSLKATLVLARIHQVLKVRVPLTEIFIHPTIRGLGETIEKTAKTSYTQVTAVEEKEYYPQSSAQKRMYILQQLGDQEGNTVYNIPYAAELRGNLEEAKLEETFSRLIARHESLRTSFQMVEGQPVQRIHPDVAFKIVTVNGAVPAPDTPTPAPSYAIETFIRPFDLSQAPLLRVGLIKLQPQKFILLLDMHHIISDGISMDILAREFMAFYAGNILPGLSTRYKDFSMWQNREPGRSMLEQQGIYWHRQFAGEIPVLHLPTDYLRPVTQSFEGETRRFHLDKAEILELKNIALEQGATLFMVLLSMYYIFLSRLSGQEDIVVGTPVGGRRFAGLEKIIGMFVNTLALRNFPRPGYTFKQFLTQVKDQTLQAFSHQDYPYEELVEKVIVDRDPGRTPLFDTMFALQNMEIAAVKIPGLEFQPYDYKESKSKFDFMLTALEENSGLEFRYQYCTKLFKQETINRYIDYFKNVVSAVLQDPDIGLGEIDIIPPREKEQILFAFNETRVDYPGSDSIHRLFAAQVEKTPDYIALVGVSGAEHARHDDGECLSYKEVNEISEGLSYLLTQKGVGRDTITAIMVERSTAMIVGILAILKAGGAYLPIDPGHPEERVNYMLKDSGAGILLTDSEIMDFSSPQASKNCPKGTPSHLSPVPATSLAYIIYTSGSTGQPKGVMVEHGNVTRLVCNSDYVNLQRGERLLPTGALEFDASTFEIWGAFLNGLALILFRKETLLAADRLKAAIDTHRIDTMWMTSPLFNRMVEVDVEIFAGLKNLLVGGDVLSPLHINRLTSRYPRLVVINGYGPTENTTFSTTFPIRRETKGPIPIGKPIANSTAYIVDRYGSLLPVGIPGELLVGGDGVARGYLNNPGLTSEKFLATEVTEGHYKKFLRGVQGGSFFKKRLPARRRLYRTGDLARWQPDGNIEFLGRIDHQVKIRGFRIETGEIENQLLSHEKIKQAIVIAVEKSSGEDKYLCAYVVSGQDLSVPALKEYLAMKLPDYMIPGFIIVMEKLPITPNGKIDLKSLPQPKMDTGENYIVPRDKIEMELAALFSELLGIPTEQIGIDTHFFKAGGHSLKATVLISRIHKQLNVKIPLLELFRYPTIRALSRYIGASGDTVLETYTGINPVEEKEYYPLAPAQKRLYILDQVTPGAVAYNMPQVLTAEESIDRDRLEHSFRELIRRHESLRTSFHMIAGQPVQRIHAQVGFNIIHQNVTVDGAVPGPGIPDLVTDTIKSFIRPFDLAQVPLLRVALIEPLGQKQILMVDIHHIITDGTSQDILTRELNALYQGEKSVPLTVQYKDYTHWQGSGERQAAIKRQGDWWLNCFRDEVPVLELPADNPRPLVQDYKGERFEFAVNEVETDGLKHLAAREGATLFMVLLASFNVFLAKISGKEDIVVGSPVAGRRHADLKPIVGMFVNTLALRAQPVGSRTYREFLHQVRDCTLHAFENQEFPLEDLVEQLDVSRDTGRNPLFDVVFILQNILETPPRGKGLAQILKPYELHTKVAKFDMTFSAAESSGKLDFVVEYSTHLFKAETILRYAGYFREVIVAVLAKPGSKISGISLIGQEEKQQILVEFNAPSALYPRDKTIHELFWGQAKKTPHQVALVGGRQTTAVHEKEYNMSSLAYMSYEELHNQSSQSAQLLVRQGAGPGTIVAVMMERSIEMIIGILAVLKSGAAYLPINPGNPPERINYMLADSGAQMLISDSKEGSTGHYPVTVLELGSLNNFGNFNLGDRQEIDSQRENDVGNRLACSETNLGDRQDLGDRQEISSHAANPFNLAYIIYTSGSTGNPKGVPISHANISPLLNWGLREYKPGTADRVLQNLSYYFDWSVWEIFITLTSGASLWITTREVLLDPHKCTGFIKTNDITVLHITPSQFQSLVGFVIDTGQKLESLKYLFIGAEKLTVNLTRQSFLSTTAECRIFNMYGPTEATIISSALEIHRTDKDKYISLSSIPIGKPTANSTAYIVDKYGSLLPVGIPGELLLGGDGVARGYLNNPELTFEKFCLRRPGALFEKTAPAPRKNFLLNHTVAEPALIGTPRRGALDPCKSFLLNHSPTHPLTHSTIYLTGDLARWQPDGNIEFLGRKDHQVKIRGYRIETEEIENCLLSHRAVKEAVVIVRQTGSRAEDKFLCAYIVPGSDVVTAAMLKEHLSRSLPEYMIPLFFVFLDKIPLNFNGKIDVKSLPAPEIEELTGDSTLPRDEIEKQLAKVWAEILNLDWETVGIDTNFFHLGGHSLKAVTMSAKIHRLFDVKIPLADFFNAPTIRAMGRYIRGSAKTVFTGLENVEKKEFYPLSFNQKRLYFIQQMEPQSSSYNMPARFMLPAGADKKIVETVIRRLIERHEGFRVGFGMKDNEPVQFIAPPGKLLIPFAFIDISGLEDSEKARRREELYNEVSTAPFDLGNPPLFRSVLVKMAPGNHELIFNLHHIISDGWSLDVLEKEFSREYDMSTKGNDSRLEPLKLQYKDYAQWQNRLLADDERAAGAKAFWKKLLTGPPPVLPLPYDREPMPAVGKESASYTLAIPGTLTRQLRGLAQEHQASLFIVLLAGINLLLYRVTGQTDIVMAIPAAARQHEDLKNIIGMFVNTLILRNTLDPREVFSEYFQRLQTNTLQVLEYQSYPMELICSELAVKYPDIPVFFNMVNIGEIHRESLEDTRAKHDENVQEAKFEWVFYVREYIDAIKISCHYFKELFMPETIEKVMHLYLKVLENISTEPGKKIGAYNLTGKRRELVRKGNG